MLPFKSAQRLGAILGSGAFYIVGGRKRVAMENLRHAFPEKTEDERLAITKGAFRNFGIAFVELLWFPNFTKTNLFQIVSLSNEQAVYDAEKAGKGIILLTGHFGSWELSGLTAGAIVQSQLVIIVQTQNNLLVDKVINEHRCALGNRVVPMGMAVREIIRTLNNHGAVALAADQSAAMESIHIEFFGRKVTTHEGPAVFSLKTGAPIIMQFIIRQPDMSYVFRFEPISTENLPEDHEAAVEELTKRHTKMLEQYIRQYPDQWLWLHRRWKHVEETSSNG